MADALCGPSNALQTLQKHTQADRTLQQDRLAFGPRPQEHFRTSPSSSNAHVDAEFEAFQSGSPIGAPLHSLNGPIPGPGLQHHNLLTQPGPGLPAWAADFQQLKIHEARQSPIPAARFRHEAPLQRSSGSGWHAEFMRQEKTATPPPPSAAARFSPAFAQQPFMHSPMAAAGFGGMHAFAPQMQQTQQQNSQVDMFDDAAFAAAFDNAAAIVARPEQKGKGKAKEQEARSAESEQEQFSLDHACVEPPEPFFADVEEETFAVPSFGQQDANLHGLEDPLQAVAQEQALGSGTDMEQGIPAMNDLDRDMYLQSDAQRHLGEESMVYDKIEEEQRMDPNAVADELSRTAGQLLDNLKHEQGEKFANSNFMALMRQLRDREVKVEGDNFVETKQALHPGGPTYPHDAFQHLPPRVVE